MRHDLELQLLHLAQREVDLLVEVRDLQLLLVAELIPNRQSTSAILGVTMSTATLTFTDANGDPAAPPSGDGSGLEVVFSSDNPAVTIGTATADGDTATAEITGTDAFNLSAVVSNTSGAPLLDDDGVTDFVQPAVLAVAATTPPVPQAVTGILSVS